MSFKEAKLIDCQEPDCKHQFRWDGIGIKPKRCFHCDNARKFAKQKEYAVKAQENRIKKNKELLSQSTFNTKSNTSSPGASKYTPKTKSGKKRTKTPRQKAMNNADNWFSRYIRIKYSFKIQDGEVFCRCIVNPNIIKLAKYFDNGHGFSRQFKPTRYEKDNCRPQNRSSNRFSGEADHYKFLDNLKIEIGDERFNRIDELRKTIGEDNEIFYKDQAIKYRKLVNKMIKEFDINKWW